MHSIKTCFDKILRTLTGVLGEGFPMNGNLLRRGPKPKFSDIEVIALSLTAESLSIDSENLLFLKIECDYKADFPNLISRRQYNDRRKALFPWQERIRQMMANKMNEINEVYAIDSMPLEICKLSRMHRNKLGKEDERVVPDKGFCASQNKYFYGYKLHGMCSPSGVIQSMDITKASVHDIHYLKDIAFTYRDCIITGDRGYISKAIEKQLRENCNVHLEVPMRSNQKDRKPVLYVFRRIRKRIETVFSQLCDQFMMQRNYAKSFNGYQTRLLAKISGMTILQFLNKFVNNRPVGQVKYALR